MGIVPLGKIFAATVKDAPALVRSSWVARSVRPAQMSKLRAVRAIAGIAVANTIAAASPYLIKPCITIPPVGSYGCRLARLTLERDRKFPVISPTGRASLDWGCNGQLHRQAPPPG